MEEDPRKKTLKCKFNLISWAVIWHDYGHSKINSMSQNGIDYGDIYIYIYIYIYKAC